MSSDRSTTILMLSANPQGMPVLQLGKERREIKRGLERSQYRDRFQLELEEAVRTEDFRRAMLDVQPQIVHFSGHGDGEAGLAFEDATGKVQLVTGEALAGLFELFADQVQCVVLNACYSEAQAKAIARHIPYVIGMNAAIGDRAAIEFAVGFYDALGAGREIEFAHKLGCSAIQLAGIPENLTPVLIKRSANGEISSSEKVKDLQHQNHESVNLFAPQAQSTEAILNVPSHRSPRRLFNFIPNFKANRLVVAGLVIVSFLGAAAIGLSQQGREVLGGGKPPCFAQAEKEGKLVVAIAELQSVGDEPTEALSIEKRLLNRLTTRLPQNITTCLITHLKVSSDSEARQLGMKWGATLMLWGQLNPLALEIYITTVNVTEPRLNTLTLPKNDAETFTLQIQTLPEIIYVMTAKALSNIYQEDKNDLEARRVLKNSLDWIELNKLSWDNTYIAKPLASAYFRLGQLYSPPDDRKCLIDRQNCINSLQAYQKASVIDQNNQQAFIEQGILHSRLGNTTEAAQIYSLIIKSSPESDKGLEARSYRADIYLSTGRNLQAIEDLQFICKHYPGDYNWLSYLGQAQLLAGQVEAFESTYLEVKTFLGTNKAEKSRIVDELREFAQKHPRLSLHTQKIITRLSK